MDDNREWNSKEREEVERSGRIGGIGERWDRERIKRKRKDRERLD